MPEKMETNLCDGEADSIHGLPPWAGKRFMETVLRKGEEYSNAILQDVRFKRKATQDEGYASEIYFFSLRFARQKKDERKCHNDGRAVEEVPLLLKSLPVGGKHQEFICKSCAFPREMKMYNETIPRMCRLLQRAEGVDYTPIAPKCFLCVEHPRRVMILEDLGATGYKLHPRRGLDHAHSKVLLRKLAHFHAASAVLYEQDPSSMQLYGESHITENELARAHWGEVLPGMVRCLADEVRNWPECGEEDVNKLNSFADSLMDHLAEAFKRDEDAFNVLNHGDLWVNNALFSYDPAGEVEDVRLIDYQSVHLSSPAIDLQYFLIVDPDDDVRHNHLDSLLELYHGELCFTLAHLGYKRQAPSLAELKADLDRNIHHALFLAATELAILLDDGFEFNAVLPNGSQNKQHAMHSSAKYKEVMQYLLPMFKAKKVL